MGDTVQHVDELLNLYAKELPAHSETAKAIARRGDVAGIAHTAESEGLHYIATGIFMCEEEEFWENKDPDIEDVVAVQIAQLRKRLPDTCATAVAIDRGAPWSEVAQQAQRDGLQQIAGLILEAEQAGLDD